ncbi:MAG: UDP-3-O-(3-hydroxymyristoyl)glucosamine N-acyltransferase [Marinilabiliales bacterium]|nr:MAG: UDP-3-O-(3-hydroxymyristoyl)glucosamine N-acyltransferase [Marinilabiliales bacterium]
MKFQKPYLLKEIAEIINAEFEGNAEFPVTGINEIHKVTEGDITFVDHPKYYKKALTSKASVVIINQKSEAPDGKHLIFSDDPFRDYNYLVKRHVNVSKQDQQIDPSALIGNNTVIQPGSFVGKNVTIGEDCFIHSNVSIYDNTIIGDHVVIHSNTVIGADAFYFKRRPDFYEKMISCGKVIIENHVEIGANCCIDKGVSGDTIIGEGTKMDNLIQIGHDTVIGKNCLFAAQVGIAGTVKIEDNVILWGQVGVNKDLVIGEGAVVYAQSGVAGTIEGGKSYFGSPAIDAREKMNQIRHMHKIPELFNKKTS